MKSVIDRVRQVAANAAVVISIGAVCAGTATAAGFEPPPISSQPSSEHHVGKMIWGELVTPDIAAAERFYGGLCSAGRFATSSTDDTHYAVALLDGEPVAGLVHHPMKSGEKHQPSWITFLAVQDVDAAKPRCSRSWRHGVARASDLQRPRPASDLRRSARRRFRGHCLL
jgi:uncharacterized protein